MTGSLCRRVEKLEQVEEIQNIMPIRWRKEGEPRPTGPGTVVRWMFDGEDDPGAAG
ncbi:MAG: hypothetical protein LBE84_08855 [Planctomycetota bacterium]|nr:hypothetical protein [Planctomycetota bacterium]